MTGNTHGWTFNLILLQPHYLRLNQRYIFQLVTFSAYNVKFVIKSLRNIFFVTNNFILLLKIKQKLNAYLISIITNLSSLLLHDTT